MEVLGPGPERLQFWHASKAKNSAHEWAMHAVPNASLLANVDADNLVPSAYVRGLVNAVLEPSPPVTFVCVRARKCEGALTGRLAYRPEAFKQLRGYCTEMPAAAGEDTDLRERLFAAARASDTSATRVMWQPVLAGGEMNGCALPNSLVRDRGYDRTEAKIANVDPAELARYVGVPMRKVFARMCERASVLSDHKARCGLSAANRPSGRPTPPWLGCWWTGLVLASAGDSAPATSPSPARSLEVEPRERVGDEALATPPRAAPSVPPQPCIAAPPSVFVLFGGLRFLRHTKETTDTFPPCRLAGVWESSRAGSGRGAGEERAGRRGRR